MLTVEVSSLSSHVGQWIVGSYREREDRSQSMAARYVPKFGRVCPTWTDVDVSRVVSSDANLGRGRRGRFDRSLKKIK